MRRHLRFFLGAILTLVLGLGAYINIQLYHQPEIRIVEDDTINYDLLCELRHLRDAMANNAANDMQELYPEGYVFFTALYGLGWCDFAKDLNKQSILYQEAHVEMQRAYNLVNSAHAKSSFDTSLPLSYGAFYTGWSTYLLGKKLHTEHPQHRDRNEIIAFKNACEQIGEIVDRQPYPASYYGSAWPADGMMCLGALAIHDKMFEPKYKHTLRSWISKIKTRLDDSGLIPHSVHAINGKPEESARGSSQSLMLCILLEIDEVFAHEQFYKYKKIFLDDRLGLPGVREYPKGSDGTEDVDSGPVILGMGGAATIVGLRAMHVYEEETLSIALRNTIEVFAVPQKSESKKKYLFGKLPIADAFITWAHAADKTFYKKNAKRNGWRTTFQFYSLVISIPLAVWLLWLWRDKLAVNVNFFKRWKHFRKRFAIKKS